MDVTPVAAAPAPPVLVQDAQPPVPSVTIAASPVTPPIPKVAEPPTDQPVRLWPLAALLLAAAVAAAAAVHRGRIVRTKQLLSLEPRLESGGVTASATALEFASPPVSIRCRMEMGTAHA